MKRRLVAFTTIAVLIAAPLVSAPAGAAGEADALRQTKSEISEIRKRLASKKRDAAEIRADVAALDSQIAELNRQIRTGEHDISSLESSIRSHQAQIDELNDRYEAASNASSERARNLYKQGPTRAVAQLLQSESLGDFVRTAVWWEIAAELDGDVMIKASRLREELKDRQDSLTSIRDDLGNQRKWLQERRDLIAAARGDRTGALARVNAQIASEERHVKELERDSQRLEAALFDSASRSTGPVSTSGFIWPLRGPINSPYGYRRGGFHSGIDIGGSYGARIVASKKGWIVAVQCGSGYGICTLVDHGNGVSTLYAHMSRKAIYSGTVDRGQTLGYVGCTGWCSGNHLHFEVRVNGQHRNPRHFLP